MSRKIEILIVLMFMKIKLPSLKWKEVIYNCRQQHVEDMFLFRLTSFWLPVVDLASVLTPEIMAPILANPEVQQRLMPYLPSGESLPQSSEELHNTLSSPQFQQVTCSPFSSVVSNHL